MTKQIVMTLLSFFLGAKADHAVAGNTAGIVDMVKENIRTEVSTLIFRALVGLVIAVTTIFAILQFGRALQIILNQSPYGVYFEVVTFGAVAAGGIYLMFAMFRPAPRIIIQTDDPVAGLNLPGLFQQFSQGLAKGFTNGSGPRTNRTIEADF